MKTKVDIEHQFEKNEILSKEKQVIRGVRIIKTNRNEEFFIEPDIDDRKYTNIVAGGLVLKIPKRAFLLEAKEYKRRLTRRYRGVV